MEKSVTSRMNISSSCSGKCSKMFYVVLLLLTALIYCSSSNAPSHLTFSPSNTAAVRHLAVDPRSGTVYVGAVNHIYQLNSNLTLEVDVSTGPKQDNPSCNRISQCTVLRPTDDYNQVTTCYCC